MGKNKFIDVFLTEWQSHIIWGFMVGGIDEVIKSNWGKARNVKQKLYLGVWKCHAQDFLLIGYSIQLYNFNDCYWKHFLRIEIAGFVWFWGASADAGVRRKLDQDQRPPRPPPGHPRGTQPFLSLSRCAQKLHNRIVVKFISDCIWISVFHQNEGGIGISIPDG